MLWTGRLARCYYERLLASQDRQSVLEEAGDKITTLAVTSRDFMHDPVMLEFLGLSHTGKLLEFRLEDALIGDCPASGCF